jgi:hypothetical protein
MVRAEGLEPPCLSAVEPKSTASTSSATPAPAAEDRNPTLRPDCFAAGCGSIPRAARDAREKWPPRAAILRYFIIEFGR